MSAATSVVIAQVSDDIADEVAEAIARISNSQDRADRRKGRGDAPVKVSNKGRHVGKMEAAGLNMQDVRAEAGITTRGRTSHAAILDYLTNHPATADEIAQNVGVTLPQRKSRKARQDALGDLIKSL